MKGNRSFYRIIVIAIVVLLVVSIICYLCSECFTEKGASIIGGVLSAVATALLGFITIWQTKKHKEMEDEINDRYWMPEIYKAETLLESINAISRSATTSFTFYSVQQGNKTINCGTFSAINAPLLNMCIESLSYGTEKIVFNVIPHSLYSKDVSFTVRLQIPETYIKNGERYIVTFVYENIYGTKYKKKMSFIYNANLCNNWKFERAKRCD